jgi:hypothetical protein
MVGRTHLVRGTRQRGTRRSYHKQGEPVFPMHEGNYHIVGPANEGRVGRVY